MALVIVILLICVMVALAFTWQSHSLRQQQIRRGSRTAAQDGATLRRDAPTMRATEASRQPTVTNAARGGTPPHQEILARSPRFVASGTTQLAIPPRSAAHAAPNRPSKPRRELPPDLIAARELLEQTYATIARIPAHMRENTTMRVEAMVAESALNALQQDIERSGELSLNYEVDLTRASNRLKRLIVSAARVCDDAALLQGLSARLPAEAALFQTAFDELAQQPELPIGWSTTASLCAAIPHAIEHLPTLEQSVSHDALKRVLHRVHGLESDIAYGHQTVVELRAQRMTLIGLLARPELALDPPWFQAIQRLGQQSRALGAGPSPRDGQRSALLSAAETVLQQRATLFEGCATLPSGGYRIDEEQLPAILGKAQAIQQIVQRIWKQARALTTPA